MKYRFLFIVFAATVATQAQDFAPIKEETIFVRKTIVNPADITIQSSWTNRTRFYQTVLSQSNRPTKGRPVPNLPVSLLQGETLLAMLQNGYYKLKNDGNTPDVTLTKVMGQKETSSTFEIDGALAVLDDEGYFMFVDMLDGNSMGSTYYSPDLKKINQYVPYSSGADQTIYGCNRKIVGFYNQVNHNSPQYKMSILNHKGELLIDKEFPSSGPFMPVPPLLVLDDRICVRLNNMQGPGSKVLTFDTNLNFLWEINQNVRLIYNTPQLNSDGKTLILITHETTSAVNTSNGATLWEIPSSELHTSPLKSKSIRAEVVMGGSYLATVCGELNYNDERVYRGELSVFDLKTGRKVFVEPVETFEYDEGAEIIDDGSRFFLIVNGKVCQYNRSAGK